MARTKLVGIEEARKKLGPLLADLEQDKTHIRVTKHGKVRGTIVDNGWYRRAREALGEPTDLEE